MTPVQKYDIAFIVLLAFMFIAAILGGFFVGVSV